MNIVCSSNDHSLAPDYFTGWKSTTLTSRFNQIPLYFTNKSADLLSKSLTSFGSQLPYRVVYMGPRHTSNFKAFKSYSRGDSFQQSLCKEQEAMYGQHLCKFNFMFSNDKQKVFPIRSLQYRLFTGMNPTIKRQDISFDSNFQCGNLDLVISVNPNEYDLLMRVDSNTCGHTNWFFFKVTTFSSKQKVKFNIINFQKSGLMYHQGFKPYCFRSSTKKWLQQGTDVAYRPKKFRYSFQSQTVCIMNSLSFSYQFNAQDEYVYFAYCIPYTYSYLMHRLTVLQKENPHFVQIDHSNFSTGGLQIPVVTVTNTNQQRDKATCLVIGRLHPGQTQGSWALDGFLSFLCSPLGYSLRQRMVFKIVPMVNVDGVVLGNFRTGIAGRDLNRVFDQPSIYHQIRIVRQLAARLNPLVFLDFHGHSAKKNVFMYGPNYGVDNKYYLTSRLYPKIISKMTDSFRYYSCIFRISKVKANAGRAVMIRDHNVTFSYTIESSCFAYGPKINEIKFSREDYCKVGAKICQGLESFIKIYLSLPRRLESKTQISDPSSNQDQTTKQHKRKHSNNKTYNPSQKVSNLFLKQMSQILSPQQQSILEQILLDERQIGASNQESEVEDSDFEEGEYPQRQLQKMLYAQRSKQTLERSPKKKKKKPSMKKQKTNNFSQQSAVSPQTRLNQEKNQVLKKDRSDLSKRLYKINHRTLKVTQRSQEKLPLISKEPSQSVMIEDFQALNQNLSKVYYNNWKRQPTPLQTLEKKYKIANSSLNHVVLNYDIEKQKEEEALQRKREAQRRKLHKSKIIREKELQLNQRKIQRNFSVKTNLQQLNGKDFLLPSIAKSNSVERNVPYSPVQDLISNYERVQRNYVRRNIKIVYF